MAKVIDKTENSELVIFVNVKRRDNDELIDITDKQELIDILNSIECELSVSKKKDGTGYCVTMR